MAQTYLCVYYDQEEALNTLSDSERGRLLSALLAYAKRSELPTLTGSEKYLWPILRASVDKNNQNYADKVKKCSEAGKASANKRQQKSTDVNGSQQTLTDVGNNNNNNNNKKSKNTFIPPTIEEVRSYCKERSSTVDPDQFYDYFTATDWHDSKGNKVKSWKGKIVTWEKFQPKQKDEDDKPDLSWFYGDDKNA